MKYKKFGLYKLVRTKTKEQVEAKGMIPHIATLARGRYLYKLKYKLIEEAKEVLRSQNKNNLKEELGDVFEVFNKILKENNISLSEIIEVMENKQKERGPISNNFLSVLEIPEESEFVDIYTKAGYKQLE